MVEERKPVRRNQDDAVLQRQYLRALSSFEGIVLSQIDIKNRLGNRLNNSIRTGIIILGAIAFSILVLLFTLTTQLNRISDVVANMNSHFSSVSEKMHKIEGHMDSMEDRVALLETIDGNVVVLDREMQAIDANMGTMQGAVSGIRSNLSGVRDRVGSISVHVDQMNNEMQAISHEIHRIGKPARTMNNMFPFP